MPKLPYPAVFTVADPLIFITPMAASFAYFQDYFSFAAIRRLFDQIPLHPLIIILQPPCGQVLIAFLDSPLTIPIFHLGKAIY
jgi:hypothetical protein